MSDTPPDADAPVGVPTTKAEIDAQIRWKERRRAEAAGASNDAAFYGKAASCVVLLEIHCDPSKGDPGAYDLRTKNRVRSNFLHAENLRAFARVFRDVADRYEKDAANLLPAPQKA